MFLHKVTVKNFRLLADVELVLEKNTTLVVGRNNSGKTSFYEAIRRFLQDKRPTFHIEDFSNVAYDSFSQALSAQQAGLNDDEVRDLIPHIELRLLFRYDPDRPELGPLSDFIIDLDPNSTEALVVARYELRPGTIGELFADQPAGDLTNETRIAFFVALRERIPRLFDANIWAEDPNDSTNRRQTSVAALSSLLKTEFINAQRGLDDNTSRHTDVLAKVLEELFKAANSPTADQADQEIAQALQLAVRDIEIQIADTFQVELKRLIPTLQTFGYPGLEGSEIETETTLDVDRLLSNHTKVRYTGHHGILLPENYNGLGMRNLIFILLQIVSFYRNFRADATAPGVHLVFIEEPEAHLHPQMQEVFIRQVAKIARQLSEQEGALLPWPVQFVISTHSSHVANAERFEAIRYFLPKSESGGTRQTHVKDLREGLSDTPTQDKNFLHKFLTLTRCDLFFADKAILIEGTTERLMLPVIIKKLEEAEPQASKLSTQYLTVVEVGGAYAHIFFDLLDFLELPTLIITDLDSVAADGTACPVHRGTGTSNACLRAWFNGDCSPTALLAKDDALKTSGYRRIAFQKPETESGPCGRTFEDAFMLANPLMFNIDEGTDIEQAHSAWCKSTSLKKSEFALTHAIDETDWVAPSYILDGLRWLAASVTHKNPTINQEIAADLPIAATDNDG